MQRPALAAPPVHTHRAWATSVRSKQYSSILSPPETAQGAAAQTLPGPAHARHR